MSDEFKNKINCLKEAVDCELLLDTLGFTVERKTSKELRAACLVHGGDNTTSFRLNRNTKTWVCFSHNCHKEIGNDVISLVMGVNNVSFSEAVSYLESITDVKYENSNLINVRKEREKQAFIKLHRSPSVPHVVSEEYLNYFKKFRSDYFIKKGFTEDLLDLFEVGGGFIDTKGILREVIPIRDRGGKLVAYSFRDVVSDETKYKYILTENFDKDGVLYNLNRAVAYLGNSKTIIVVEGFKSVWKLHMIGFDNVVAVMGSVVTEGQKNLLYSVASNVVVLFDYDEAGVKGADTAINEMAKLINIKALFLPVINTDPAEYDVKELKMFMDNNL